MVAIPTIRSTNKPTRQLGGPVSVDTEFAAFLEARRGGRVLSQGDWIARRNQPAPRWWRRLLGRA